MLLGLGVSTCSRVSIFVRSCSACRLILSFSNLETMSLGRRIFESFKSPWVVFFSSTGLAYGLYNVIDMTQSGRSYVLDENLTGKTYIVTGATSGIGLVGAY